MIRPARVLHVYYRHVPISAHQLRHPGRDRPKWFSHEACLRNFLATVQADPLASRVRMTMVYDGTLEDLRTDFVARHITAMNHSMQVNLIQGGSAAAAWYANLALVRQTPMQPHDLVYLVENDYLHQSGWVGELFALFDSGQRVDYASLYDHRDKYEHPYYHQLQSRLVATASHHWRTAPSTCGSFVLTREVFDADLAAIVKLPDFQLFSLLVGQQGRVLMTPVPSLATHCMAQYLAPTVDWQRLAAV
jgi:hypothetical protein